MQQSPPRIRAMKSLVSGTTSPHGRAITGSIRDIPMPLSEMVWISSQTEEWACEQIQLSGWCAEAR